ncbi:MAG: MFS transporter [Bacteroidota bacterium]|nr:MFS transporter [Bacteroidota bacterium]
MLINRSGTMVIPFMTLYLTSKEMHRSLSDAGLVIALFGMGAIIGSYFGGKFTDKIGFQKVQLITLLFGGILFIVLGQIKSYPLICLCTFILSTVNEAFRPANSSAIAFYSTPKNRTRSYSLNRMAINLGWAVGASIGGFIAAYNYELLFWVDGFTNIGAALILFFILKPAHKKNVEGKPKEVEIPIAHSAYKDKTYLWFIFLVTLFAFCFFQLFTTIPKYFRDDLHLGERYIGFVMALNGLLIVALEMVIIVMLEKKRRNLFIISVGLIVCASSFLVLLIPGYGKIISFLMILLITLGEIMSMPFMNTFWTMRSNEKNRGQYAALYSIAWGIAQTAGPYLCSKLVEATNFNVMFMTIAGVFIFTSFCFYRLSKIES